MVDFQCANGEEICDRMQEKSSALAQVVKAQKLEAKIAKKIALRKQQSMEESMDGSNASGKICRCL